MIRKKGKILKLIIMTMALFMAVPVQAIWAAPGKVTTMIKHKPPKDDYIPGFRIQLNAKIKDKAGFLATRCYFKAKKDKVFTFVNMNNNGGGKFRAILPAPWVNSEFIEYVFVVVNKTKQVTRSQTFKIEEGETEEAVKWQDASEVKEVRIDKAQEVVEEYEAFRKLLRKRHESDRAKYQIESQDVMEVSTEVDKSLVSLRGFYDAMTVSQVPPYARYGILAKGIYTDEQLDAAGSAEQTGATSAGMASTTGGISVGAIVGATVGVAVIAGAAVAIAGNNDDSSDGESHHHHYDKSSPSASTDSSIPINIGDATAKDFLGTFFVKVPGQNETNTRINFYKDGAGSWETWNNEQHDSGTLSWSIDPSTTQMTLSMGNKPAIAGSVSGNTHNFSLNGSNGQFVFTRQ